MQNDFYDSLHLQPGLEVVTDFHSDDQVRRDEKDNRDIKTKQDAVV